MSHHHTVRVIVVALCAIAIVSGDYQLPASVKTCKRDSDDFASCLRLAIQEAWPTFLEGVPELNMPPLDPYYTDSNTAEYSTGQLHGKMISTDVRTYGLAKARFLSVKPEITNDFARLEVDVEIPKILIDGNYDADGSIGTFRVGGKGFFNVSLEDVRSTWEVSGPIVDDRWVIEHFKVMPTVGNMKIWFSDLFNGNEDLNRAAMVFVNEYWPVVYRGMLPKMMEMWDVHLSELSNRFFSKVPFSTVFPS